MPAANSKKDSLKQTLGDGLITSIFVKYVPLHGREPTLKMEPFEEHAVGVPVFALGSVRCCIERGIFPHTGVLVADSPALETCRLCDGETSLHVLVGLGIFFVLYM